MVGRKNKSKNGRRSQRVKKSVRRARSVRRQSSTRTTGVGNLVAKGIRTLLSVLPGSSLTTGIADFAFKSLGYTDVIHHDSRLNTIEAAIKVTSVTANFHIALKDILFDSYTHGVKIDLANWQSNYQSGRLISVEIKVVPETPMGERRGILGAAFIPFRTDEERKWYDANASGVLIEQLRRIPGSKSGPAGNPIVLKFSPSAQDGRLNFDMALKDEIGAVIITFDQTSRDSYGMFTADQFSAMVYVSGSIRLQRPQEDPIQINYKRTIDDKLKDKAIFFKTPRDGHFSYGHVSGTLRAMENNTGMIFTGPGVFKGDGSGFEML